MREHTKKIVKIIIYATLAIGLVLLFGGYSFIKRQYAITQCAPIEQKMLECIAITEEERLPLELITAVINEYEEKGLQSPDMGETMITLRETLLSRELNSGIDKTKTAASCEYAFYTNLIRFNVTDSTDTSPNWRVTYRYTADGLIYKSIWFFNEVIGDMLVSSGRGTITLYYSSEVDLPTQWISIEDYNKYMEARETGKIAKTQRLSIKNMLRYVNKPINTITESEYFKSAQEVVAPVSTQGVVTTVPTQQVITPEPAQEVTTPIPTQKLAYNEYNFQMAQAIPLANGSCKLPESIEAPLMGAAYIGETDLLIKELIISSAEDMDLSTLEIEQIYLKFNEQSGASINPENITRQDNYVQLDYTIDPIKYSCRVYFDGYIFKEVSILYEDVEFTVRNGNNALLGKINGRTTGKHEKRLTEEELDEFSYDLRKGLVPPIGIYSIEDVRYYLADKRKKALILSSTSAPAQTYPE